MHERLLDFYERELEYLHELGDDFAKSYPRIAGALSWQPGRTPDPHVERLIQSFAFLTARIQRKLDDQFPEITDGLLGTLAPNFLNPIPSMAIAQFGLDPIKTKRTTPYSIPQGTPLYSRPVNYVSCQFKTCYPLALWPLELTSAQLTPPELFREDSSARSMIRLHLQCFKGHSFEDFDLTNLRFFLDGDPHQVFALYELLFNNLCEMWIRPVSAKKSSEPREMDPNDCIQPVGFHSDESILGGDQRSLGGFCLLQEYFSFPYKFLFFDLCGLECIKGLGKKVSAVEVFLLFDRDPPFDRQIASETFRLGCTPVINLFEKNAEPIRLEPTQFEYKITPDLRLHDSMEINSVEQVSLVSTDYPEGHDVRPLYSFTSKGELEEHPAAFWYAKRQVKEESGRGNTDVLLNFVDLGFRPTKVTGDTLLIRVTCTNGNLPQHLMLTSRSDGDFFLDGGDPSLLPIRCRIKPTARLTPPIGGKNQWRLISLLSINNLSLVDGAPNALREVLQLCEPTNWPFCEQHIAGVVSLMSSKIVRRPLSWPWNAFCRGQEIVIEFDEENFVGGGLFLFASVLESFLGMFATMNSFVEFVAKTRHPRMSGETLIKRWPPRSGTQILL